MRSGLADDPSGPNDAPGAYGSDRWLMAHALYAARLGLGTCAPNPSVGAAIYDPTGYILISRGTTQPGGRPHAEPTAIANADCDVTGMTMAVTLEPCSHYGRSPPCVLAIQKAGLRRVIYAAVDPDPRVAGRGLDQLRDAGIDVVAADADHAAEARWITRGHILRVTERRPFVQLKLAVGSDGRIARAVDGSPSWVTGQAARARGHMLRATSDAILIGTGTAIEDRPALDCRLPGLTHRSPMRIVIGKRGIAAAGALKVSQPNGPETLFVVPSDNVQISDRIDPSVGRVVIAQSIGDRLWLPDVLERLVSEGVTRLLVEGGPAMWRAFADMRRVDEVVLFHARGTATEPVSEDAAAAAIRHYVPGVALSIVSRRAVGGDDMFVLRSNEPTGWAVDLDATAAASSHPNDQADTSCCC